MSSNASLTHDIYQRIRNDLICGKLPPGTRLKTKELSEALSVSLGVVREALSRLTAEGFVLSEPQRGFTAPPLSPDEMMQLSEGTASVEGFCLRRAIEVGDLEWEIRVAAAYYRFSKMPMNDQAGATDSISPEFTNAYSEFRRALVAACDNKWMLNLREILHAQTERYRQVCMVLGVKGTDFREGYAPLVDAVLARNADRAEALLEMRIKSNARRMRDTLQKIDLAQLAADLKPVKSSKKPSVKHKRAYIKKN
jgi:DNA-binding GntR family transcriptional regulator